MTMFRVAAAALLLHSAAFAASELKIDRTRSFVDVDVKATVDSFTGHLDDYDVAINLDDSGKPKTAVFTFKFADLKTGKDDRDKKMIEWLGGGDPAGKFELGALALAPDGQGHATGRLTFHEQAQVVEVPVTITQLNGEYTIAGSTTINTTNWGLKVIRIALLLKVDPEVKVRFKFVGTPVETKPAS